MDKEGLQEKSKDELIEVILRQEDTIDRLKNENYKLKTRVKNLYDM